MPGGPKQYVRKVAVSWGKTISGPLFAVFSFALLISQLAAKDAPTAALWLAWGSWLTLDTAAIFVLIAQFRVWRDENGTRLELEEKLHAAADMRGPIWVQLSAVNPNADQSRPASAIGYKCDCSNHGKVPCELNKVHLNIVPPNGFGFTMILDIVPPVIVDPGRAFQHELTCGVQGTSPEDLRKAKITIFLVDSLGKEYQNTETKVTPLVLKMPPPHAAGRPVRLSMRDGEF